MPQIDFQPIDFQPDGDEPGFRDWYAAASKQYGLNPDPDASDSFYDYRAAYRAGAKPDASGHWPSDFKKPGHPNMVVGGFNVQTGERVPGTPRAKDTAELVRLGWDEQTAAKLAATQSDAKAEAMAAVNMGGPNVGWENTKAHPVQTAAMLAIPGLMGVAGKIAPSLVRAAASPAGQAAMGAAYGGYQGGVPGAVAGAVGGYTTGKLGQTNVSALLKRLGLEKPKPPDAVITGLSQAGRAASRPPVDQFDAILARRKAANPEFWADGPITPKPTPVAPKPERRVNEPSKETAMFIARGLGRRSTDPARVAPQVKTAAPAAKLSPQEMLAQEIDYRLTDAVPIDAITRDISRKGGSILEAGESIPGLADRVAQATKAAKASGNWDEVEKLGRALRQRMHITRKVQR